ncbi:hypothetical protein [Hyphomonas jannaschiana]|uniref:hypothetical protein n=1 Tax=Hyphomonas jannaschiana TaxID=86 RepID=UPI0035C6620B
MDGDQILKSDPSKSVAKMLLNFFLIGIGLRRIGKTTRLGRVRIPYDVLIEKIDEYSNAYNYEVRAYTRHHHFDSLDEIKQNPELICGRPMIFIGPVDVFFGKHDTQVTVLKPDDENAKRLYERLVAFLKLYHSKLSYFFLSGWLILAFILISALMYLYTDIVLSTVPTALQYAYLLIVFTTIAVLLLNSIFRLRILPKGYESFLSGRTGDIVIAVVVAAITSILFPYVSRLLEM